MNRRKSIWIQVFALAALWLCTGAAAAAPLTLPKQCSVDSEPVDSPQKELKKLVAGGPNKSPEVLTGSVGSGLPGSASLESMIIQGLTSFVIERARQETITFILDRVQGQVCKKGGEARTLFPNTCGLFDASDDAGIQITPGRMFRWAIAEDLRTMPYHLAVVADGKRKAAEQANDAEAQKTWRAVASGFLLAGQLSCALEDHQPPLEFVLGIASDDEMLTYLGFDDLPPQARRALRLIIAVLRQADADQIKAWIAQPRAFADYLAQYVRGEVARVVLSGLEKVKNRLAVSSADVTALRNDPELKPLIQVVDAVHDRVEAFLRDGASDAALASLIADLRSIRGRITGSVSELDKAAAAIAEAARQVAELVKNPADASTQLIAIRQQFESARGALEAALAGVADKNAKFILNELKSELEKQWSESALRGFLDKATRLYNEHLEPLAPRVVEVYQSVQRLREAGDDVDKRRTGIRQLVTASIALLKQILLDEVTCKPGKDQTPCTTRDRVVVVLDATALFVQGDYDAAVIKLLTLVQSIPEIKKLPGYKQLARFAPLFTEVAAAKTSDEVAAAIESAAAPLGSWRRRRKENTWGLSGRLGFGGGLELVNDETALTTGLSLPIVMDYWWARPTVPIGVGVQLVDLGTVATFSEVLGEDADDVEDEPNLSFVQLFSPGITVSFGLGDSPFMLSVTGAWAPALRTDVATEETRSALRVVANFSVDVPIFMF